MKKDSNDWKKPYNAAQPQESAEHEAPVLFYNDTVIEHFTNPRNVGEMPDADGYALIGDPSCGDQMKLWIKVDAGYIVDIKFKSFGCPGAIATSSMTTTLAMGMALEDAKKLTDDDIVRALGGIPANKEHCSLMGVGALQEAIRDYEAKKDRSHRQPEGPDSPA